MATSVSLFKIISYAAAAALIGHLLVKFLGLGIQDNGSLGTAIGLFVGFMISAVVFVDIKSPIKQKSVRKNNADANRMMSIFVGNLAYKVRGRQLAALFEPFGEIQSLRIVKDRETGKAKGFGFIEMTERNALRAISELDNSEFFGRNLKVSEANSQKVD